MNNSKKDTKHYDAFGCEDKNRVTLGYSFKELENEVERLKKWVGDLQGGMWVNCVYCGYRYEPQKTTAMADLLQEHIENCTQHPMYALKKENERLRNLVECVSHDIEYITRV